MVAKVQIPPRSGVVDQKPTLAFEEISGPISPFSGPIIGLRQVFDEACQESGGRIELRTGFFFGKPRFTGKRLAVYDVLYALADSLSIKHTMEELEGLDHEDIRAAMRFAAMVCENEV